MKKITLLVAVVIAASFASCKKSYTCECTFTANSVSTKTSTTSGKMKKADAKKWCETSSGSGYSSVSCSLK